ncbi:hypothetical protein KGF57_003805 [Candida theae]|uniref:Prokaryotic-type class I peptide chain release factors domain-containing protein n=1 Tax=Candida theae TaxID=1198502 RepID=A0AAD5FXN3_9ASCO|nr:uncharacterized protein KGF57_003805 [Candida theae]KAI5954782.1 hypothetical protein KGF57_003805 [Candida theae]
MLQSRLPPSFRIQISSLRYSCYRLYSNSSEIAQSKEWLDTFDSSQIPRHLFSISYSRSSGPGGQKVNKTSSKATVALGEGEWLQSSTSYWIPSPIRQQLQENPIRYETKSKGLLIQCDTSRSRDQNTEECFSRLLAEIKSKVYFPGEVKEEDKAKWVQLEADFKERKKFNKQKQSEKKRNRVKKFDL